MADDQIKEMISAFAIGCMDRKNYKQFRKHLENKGELPKGELGDLQNIISLIPTILDFETPNAELKNELGKRLIQIQKDIKNKVVENRRETRIEAEEDFVRRDASTKIFSLGEKQIKETPKPSVEKYPRPATQKPITRKQKSVTRLNTISEPPKKESNLINKLHLIFTGILFVIIIILFFVFFGRISELEETNSTLNNKVIKLRTDLTRTNNFINQNMEFVEFFNNPYIEIIPLKAANNGSNASGRLFIAFGSGEGLLQLQNMPHIDTDMIFQLWLVSKTETFSLGTFEIKPDKKYMPISEIPFMMKEDIKMFMITKEKKEETLAPTGETVLFGAIRKVVPSTKKRRKRRR